MFDQTEMKTVIVVSTDCYDDDDEMLSNSRKALICFANIKFADVNASNNCLS